MADEKRKQEPLLKELQVTRIQLSQVSQQAHANDKELTA